MSLFKKFFSVGAATLSSRALGFIREMLIASALGAGPVADAFYAAFRFPNLFRRFFAEGAFNLAFVPMFAKKLEEEGKKGAREFAEQVFSVLLTILVALSVLAHLFMPFLVGTIIAPKFIADPEKFDLTVLLTQIMFPYLTAASLVAMMAGILNSFHRYFLAALAPVLLNIVFIAILLMALFMGIDDTSLGIFMAVGVTFSGVLQVLMLAFGVRHEGFGLSWRRPKITAPVKQLLWLAVPTVIAGGITQINLLVSQIIASGQEGAISIMNYADRVMQLPLGVIAISIGVVLLPELTRALAGGREEQALDQQNRSLEFGLALTLPASIGMIVMAEPVMALLYERGAFGREQTLLGAGVLAAFGLGLPSFVLIKIFQPGFYARHDTKTPMWFAGLGALANIAFALLLFPKWGVVGLGLATSIAGWINALALAATLFFRKLFKLDKNAIRNIILIVIASAVLGGFVYFAMFFWGDAMMNGGFFLRLALTLGTIVGAIFIYFTLVITTGAIPRASLKRLLRRKK